MLILRGQNSDLLLPETVVEMKRRGVAAKQAGCESIEIPDCGHAPALMADEQIQVVEDFLLADNVAGAPRQTHGSGRPQTMKNKIVSAGRGRRHHS